jgi:hypothetical protein
VSASTAELAARLDAIEAANLERDITLSGLVSVIVKAYQAEGLPVPLIFTRTLEDDGSRKAPARRRARRATHLKVIR